MITKDKVVSFQYTLKDNEGNVLDASQDKPLSYLHGHQNIIPGLENELSGLDVGAKKQVTVAPEQGYGEYRDELKMALPLAQFGARKPEVGMMVQLGTPNGDTMMATIVGIANNQAYLDGNHPLAGQTLHFDVEIVDIRDASSEEISHGHPHGPGGHHH
jgi:FKBP-type peptidyl-prolyl cis-trans isomerase SlyD